MRHGSLFSGIGGFDLAAEWCGWTNIFQVEIDDFCNKVLEKHFPETERHRDIYEFNGTKYRGRVDIISGGFPCQPFSQAGRRQGTKDNRYLWPEMLRVISEVRSSWVVGENVTGILSMENGRTLERILLDLEAEGYQVEVFVIPACSVGAWHRRDRVWIIANHESDGCGRNKIRPGCGISERLEDERQGREEMGGGVIPNSGTNTNTRSRGQSGQGQSKQSVNTKEIKERKTNQSFNGSGQDFWTVEPDVGRVAHGVPSRVDRLKSLGNAIVPQVAYEIFKAIDKWDG